MSKSTNRKSRMVPGTSTRPDTDERKSFRSGLRHTRWTPATARLLSVVKALLRYIENSPFALVEKEIAWKRSLELAVKEFEDELNGK